MSRSGLIEIRKDLVWRFYNKWLENHGCQSEFCDCEDIIQEMHVLRKQEESAE